MRGGEDSSFSIQRVHIGKSPYIVLVGNPKSKNEINNFGSYVICTCDFASASLDDIRFLNSSVCGVSCEYKWVKETICRFLCGKCQYVGITDPKHNIKNNRFQNLEDSFPEVMGSYLFDTGFLDLSGVSHILYRSEYFISDPLVLKL